MFNVRSMCIYHFNTNINRECVTNYSSVQKGINILNCVNREESYTLSFPYIRIFTFTYYKILYFPDKFSAKYHIQKSLSSFVLISTSTYGIEITMVL